VQNQLVNQESKTDHARGVVLTRGPEETVPKVVRNQLSVVGKMQAADALDYWRQKIGPSPVVMDWLMNGVPLYPRGALVIAAQPVPKQYVLSVEQEKWAQKELDRLITSSAHIIEEKAVATVIVPSPTSSPSVLCNGSLRGGRAMEKSKLAFSGSKSELVEWLLKRAQSLSWNQRLDKAWDLYTKYCKFMKLEALPSSGNTLVSFLVWLDLTNSFAGCADVLAAVSRGHLEAQLPDPSKEYNVKRVYKALLKEYKKDKEPNWPRDPPDNKPQFTSREFWVRDAALVAIGLRTMRRTGELCNLRLRDVKFEATNSSYCPDKLLKKYLWVRPKTADDQPLFLSRQGDQLSVGAVGAIVKRVAENAK
ncbi:36250_t:CDS:2, partial [Gigaspora margarita]